MKIITIIPAAGRGTRVNLSIPKILIRIGKKKIIDILINKIKKVSQDFIFVVNPEHAEKIKKYLDKNYKDKIHYRFVIQKKPLGMANAVDLSVKYIKYYQKILIIWGDHIGVSKNTINKICNIKYKNSTCILPLVKKKNPYVEYFFSKNKLLKINETREGDICSNIGFSDTGTFLFQSSSFKKIFDKFKKKQILGKITKEQNFLPFILFLSRNKWNIKKKIIINNIETEGINTKEDIKNFRLKCKD